MASEVHDFLADHAKGDAGERVVGNYLSALGFVVRATGQVLGEWPDGAERIYDAPDFLVEGHVSGKPTALAGKTVECKSDSLGHETSNSVLELMSNVGTGRLGWVYTSKADFVAFYYPGNGKVILAAMPALRKALENWQTGKVFPTANSFFSSLAILVPTSKLEAVAVHVGNVAPGAVT